MQLLADQVGEHEVAVVSVVLLLAPFLLALARLGCGGGFLLLECLPRLRVFFNCLRIAVLLGGRLQFPPYLVIEEPHHLLE